MYYHLAPRDNQLLYSCALTTVLNNLSLNAKSTNTIQRSISSCAHLLQAVTYGYRHSEGGVLGLIVELRPQSAFERLTSFRTYPFGGHTTNLSCSRLSMISYNVYAFMFALSDFCRLSAFVQLKASTGIPSHCTYISVCSVSCRKQARSQILYCSFSLFVLF